MPIDTSLINQLRPVRLPNQTNALMQALQAQGLARQDEAAQMDMEQRKRENALSQAYAEAMRGGSNLDDPATVQRLTQIDPMRTQSLLKEHMNTKKLRGEVDAQGVAANKARFEQLTQALPLVDSPKSLVALMQHYQFPEPLQQGAIAKLQNGMPLDQLKRMMVAGAAGAAKQFDMMTPKLEAVFDGRTKSFVDVNPDTNPGGPAPITMKPTIAEEQAARNDLIGPDGKPNAPVVALKHGIARAGASNVSINTGQKGYDNERALRGDFRQEPVYKAHQEVQAAHAQIKQALSLASPAGDLAGATKIMKILDPGSVVRESELGMAMAASGLLDRAENYASMVLKGTKLTPAQRKDFQALADRLMGESVSAFNAKRSEYDRLGGEYGMNSGRALGPEARMPGDTGAKPDGLSDAERAELAELRRRLLRK